MGQMKLNNKINVVFVFSAYELPILTYLNIIIVYTHVFMLILSEISKLRIFYFFHQNDFKLL
jgi:hypothetical protein